MNAFQQASEVAKRSWAVLQPFIESRAYEGRYVVTSKGRLAKELQVSVGDVLFNSDPETIWGVELKAEQRTSKNFFLETWSNRHTYRPGWMWTLDADLLLYHFLESDDVYCIDFRRLKRWFHNCEHLCKPPSSEFDIALQGQYEQRNLTCGALVPIARVEEAIGFDLVHPQRGLTDTRHAVAKRYEQMNLLAVEAGSGSNGYARIRG